MRTCILYNLIYDAGVLPSIIKHGLILIVYQKICSLSQCVVDSQGVGKLMNILSADFNKI